MHKNYYNNSDMLDSEIIVGYNMVTMKLEVQYMLAIPELAMPRSRKVTTVCNGRREVWTDYEEAKAYFLDLMMSTESAFIFNSCTDLMNVVTKMNKQESELSLW